MYNNLILILFYILCSIGILAGILYLIRIFNRYRIKRNTKRSLNEYISLIEEEGEEKEDVE